MTLLDEAIVFATEKHSGQRRKLGKMPYILHPLEVAGIIASITDDEEVMAAGVLHDTIEDCNVDPREIKRRFGPRVSALVQSETEDKMSERPASETWLERKQDTIMILKMTNDMGVKILWLGDKLSNIRSFYRHYLEMGEGLWQKFHQTDPKMHEWYYRTILENLSELSHTEAYKEYAAIVDKLFTAVNENNKK